MQVDLYKTGITPTLITHVQHARIHKPATGQLLRPGVSFYLLLRCVYSVGSVAEGEQSVDRKEDNSARLCFKS